MPTRLPDADGPPSAPQAASSDTSSSTAAMIPASSPKPNDFFNSLLVLAQIPPVVLLRVERLELVLDVDQALELAGFLPVAAAQFDEGGGEVGFERAVFLGAAAGGGFAEHGLHRLDLGQGHPHRIEVPDDRGVHVVLFGARERGDGKARRAAPARAGEPIRARVEVAGGEAAAVLVARVHPQAEHQQAVVADAAEAFELAGDEHWAELAVDRAFIGDVLEPLDAEVERGLPGAAEALAAGLA